MESQTKQESASQGLSRRRFLKGASAAAAFTIVPRFVLGGEGNIPPSERVNVAVIGCGGMGGNNIKYCEDYANFVALCDVDEDRASGTYQKYPDVPKFKDFRKMLDKMDKDIDAVIIATPDHIHATATMDAIKRGKHVYTQKPLTHTIYEARALREEAKKAGVMTQMGNQGRSGEGTCLIKEWFDDGALGEVREVHCWTDRPGRRWPQGVGRPKDTPPVPATLDWDLWLGPAPERPYHPDYMPFNWRGWWDFGCGALGDMGCHIIDQPFDTLQLGYPTSVEACYTITEGDEKQAEIEKETGPVASIVKYEFPERGKLPPATLYWYDGGMKPFRPDDLEDGRNLSDNGMLFVGSKTKLLAGCYGNSPRLIPEVKMKAYKRPPETLRRVPEGTKGHEQDWLRSCKDGQPAKSNFDYSGMLTEVVLLGNLAIRSGGKKLMWDGPNMKVTNVPEANDFVHFAYRPGWTL